MECDAISSREVLQPDAARESFPVNGLLYSVSQKSMTPQVHNVIFSPNKRNVWIVKN